MQEEVDHMLYPKSSLQEADAVAWIATSKDAELQQYPFKFQPLEPTEVRLKILHTAICHSDVMHLRGLWGNSFITQVINTIRAVRAMKLLGKSHR